MSIRRRPSGEPPPLPHDLDAAALSWAAVFGLWVLVWAWFFLFGDADLGTWITKYDLKAMAPIVNNRSDWLTPGSLWLNRFTQHWAIPLFGWTTIAVGLATRRFRHLLIHIGVLTVIAALWAIVAAEIQRPRPVNVEIIGHWDSYAHPSRPFALLTPIVAALVLVTTPPGRPRRYGWLATGTVFAILGYAQIYVGVEHPTDIVVSICMGIAITLLAFRVLAPESAFPITYRRSNSAHIEITAARNAAISQGSAEQLGLSLKDITPVGLDRSAGSTALALTLDDGSQVFAKLYATRHLRSDRWYKLGRTLLYGRLEDEHHFTSVRRLVGHEDHMLRLAADIDLPAPRPLGVVEITPDREYLVVMTHLPDAVTIDQAEVNTSVIDSALAAVRSMWDNGVAHRDIKPDNVMATPNGTAFLVDLAFGQVRPSPWRQAVDLANMILVLALSTPIDTVIARARLLFSDDELAEAFAAARGVALPSQLRREIKRSGRPLLTEGRRLVPQRDRVRVQRWTPRRVLFTLASAAVVALATAAARGGLDDLGYFG